MIIINNYKDLIFGDDNMENVKELLENGDLVIFKNGDKAIYLNEKFSFTDGAADKLGNYNEDLTAICNRDYDIMSILRTPIINSWVISIINQSFGRWNIIWERKEKTPEYTIEQLIEKVGHEFKIKKSN